MLITNQITLANARLELLSALSTPLGKGLTGQPVCLVSDPGIGKTAIVEQVAKSLGRKLVPLILSTKEGVDVTGALFYGKEGLEIRPPPWAKPLWEGPSLLFLDELSCAPPATQGAALGIPVERRIGELALPDSCVVVAAMNPSRRAAGGFAMSYPMANRWTWMYVRADASEWITWVLNQEEQRPEYAEAKEWGIWVESYGRARALGSTFIENRPELLHKIPEAGEPGAYPTPRSWERALRLLAMAFMNGRSASSLVAGTIGEAVAADFLRSIDEIGLPRIGLWLDGAESWSPSVKRGDQALAVYRSALALVLPRTSENRARRADRLFASVNEAAEIGLADAAYDTVRRLDSASLVTPEALKANSRLAKILQRVREEIAKKTGEK